MVNVAKGQSDNTMSIKSNIFGEVFFPSEFLGKIITDKDDRGEDVWWVEGDIKLARQPTEGELANLGGHFLVRSKHGNTVYLKCMACMEKAIGTTIEHEQAVHGFFIEHDCDGKHETIEKLNRMAGQV